MNLFSNPSLSEFQKLISKVTNGKAVHDLVLDYDGEVLIDPQLEQPDLDLDKFKVHIRLQSLQPLKNLFNYLLNAWNDNFPREFNISFSHPQLSR
jgi:hypothetical protein